ncbi:hypothetical protein AMECASPLE_022222 [Ameca splendens]|uniref:Uncharacterized protein n=1 Tax=Ameca splendens TaxID=208324 RepID=A0ABV0ZPZ3_9TELE
MSETKHQWGNWCLLPAVYGEDTGQVATPSLGNPDIQDKQPRTHSFTPKGYLKRPVDLTVMFLDCGRIQSRTRENPHMQKDPQPGVEPRTFLLQQCYQLCHRAAPKVNCQHNQFSFSEISM